MEKAIVPAQLLQVVVALGDHVVYREQLAGKVIDPLQGHGLGLLAIQQLNVFDHVISFRDYVDVA